jgi:hypothetical protein
VAIGEGAGPSVRRYGGMPGAVARWPAAPCHARHHGFDLHAGIVARAGRRERLEHLCRYALCPPMAEARLHVDDAGRVSLRLRHRWADGRRTCDSIRWSCQRAAASNETIVPEHEYGISTWNQFGGPLFAIGSTRTRVAPRSR